MLKSPHGKIKRRQMDMQCTAMSKAKLRQGLPRSECRCRRRAVKGYTVCQVHGAGSPYKGRKGGGPMKTGQHSKHKEEFADLSELIQSFRTDDELCDLNQDVATLRALLSLKLDQIDLNDPKSLDRNVHTVRDLMRDIRYTVQQKSDIESQYLIPIENVQMFLQNVMLVLTANIQDKDLLHKIVSELQGIRVMEADIYQRAQYGLPNKKR